MRRFLPILFLLAGAVAWAGDAPVGVAPTPPPTDGPRLKFDAVDLNLGDVVRGGDAVATFTYHNTGNAPLKILSAKPG